MTKSSNGNIENEKNIWESIQLVASSIYPSIKVIIDYLKHTPTIDYPCAYSNNKFPALDTELWLGNGNNKGQFFPSMTPSVGHE